MIEYNTTTDEEVPEAVEREARVFVDRCGLPQTLCVAADFMGTFWEHRESMSLTDYRLREFLADATPVVTVLPADWFLGGVS